MEEAIRESRERQEQTSKINNQLMEALVSSKGGIKPNLVVKTDLEPPVRLDEKTAARSPVGSTDSE
jgi:hypothetical protein